LTSIEVPDIAPISVDKLIVIKGRK
jgi:hypothetical protein